ncbi:antilisterial bacteriocin subtilosin biosynthesis protein AlbA [Methanobrevibacter cuticularis]|uniref:Antilisterial bacteriocin subtilosin biosynthesis protein AlbA n=1 Tax=Methanobrevibacter cuticularis TaxID=47311 RepID=A0A166EPF2_9EURY|nr:radical SAM protein [Methanobrevibacter cuticularis]KZX16868.1 antilisterial bacteriocin subtilosin biosynthesis protein AlbA [Methanobrevibacter cuticularis]
MTHNRSNGDSNDVDMSNMIGMFRKIADNPLSKYLLKKSLNYCEKDEAVKLESALNYYLGKTDNACYECKILSKIVGFIIKRGISGFGASEEEFNQVMDDDYWIRGLSSVLKGIALFGVTKPFVPGAPFQVVWNITKACNMRCIHCYESASTRQNDELSKNQVINGLDQMAHVGVASVAFSGGEPSIHPNILDFIKHVDDIGMCAAMATNGYTLSDEYKAEKFVNEGLEFIQISLDGINPQTHDSFRMVDGAWNNAVETIKNFVDLGIFVEVATTVTEHNLDEIPEMIDFLRDLGVNWFMLYNFIPTGNGNEVLDIDLAPEDRLNLLKTAYKENNNDMQILSTAPQYAPVAESMSSNEDNMIPTHFYNPEYTNPMLMQLAEFIGGCGAGRFYMSIEPNGDLYPCVFFPHEDDVKAGNLLENDFEDVWLKNNVLKELRDKTILKGYCRECDSRNICGGCRARAYNYFDDILAPDPGCTNNQKDWDYLKKNLSKENFSRTHNDNLILDLIDKN